MNQHVKKETFYYYSGFNWCYHPIFVYPNTTFEDGALIHDEQTAPNDQWGRMVKVVNSEDSLRDVWSDYHFQKNQPAVDFSEIGILIAQTTENSCPKHIEKFQIDTKEKKLIIETNQKETTCDDIGFPRTFVFQIDKEKLGKVDIIQFEKEEFLVE